MSEAVVQGKRGRHVPVELADKLLRHLRAGTTDLCDSPLVLEPAVFTDAGVARREIDGIFGTVPFIVAHSSELPNPHDCLAKRLPRNEVIIVRQPDRSVRTFVNACRHRGTTLASEGPSHCRVFSCPYHGWSYDSDGSLRNITYADSFGDVDTAQLGLVEIPTEERHGFVWVVDNPKASIDVAEWLGSRMDEILATYGIEDYECFRARSFDEPVNWKIMHDAFLDGYHIKYAHPNSAGRVVHTNIYSVEDCGHHARFGSPRKSFDQWIDHDPAADEDLLPHVMVVHFVGPNCTLLQLQDHFQLLSFYPISDNPAESRMEMRVMVPPLAESGMSEVEWTDQWEKNWDILQKVLAAEDFPILRGIQKGYASRDAAATVLGRNEILNQAFHREVARMRDATPPAG